MSLATDASDASSATARSPEFGLQTALQDDFAGADLPSVGVESTQLIGKPPISDAAGLVQRRAALAHADRGEATSVEVENHERDEAGDLVEPG
jgi:hypothetical protein